MSKKSEGFIHLANVGKNFPSKGIELYNELCLCNSGIEATSHEQAGRLPAPEPQNSQKSQLSISIAH